MFSGKGRLLFGSYWDAQPADAWDGTYSFWLLMHLSCKQGKRKFYRAPLKIIADHLGVSEKTIARARDVLKNNQWLHVTRTGRSDYYRLVHPETGCMDGGVSMFRGEYVLCLGSYWDKLPHYVWGNGLDLRVYMHFVTKQGNKRCHYVDIPALAKHLGYDSDKTIARAIARLKARTLLEVSRNRIRIPEWFFIRW